MPSSSREKETQQKRMWSHDQRSLLSILLLTASTAVPMGAYIATELPLRPLVIADVVGSAAAFASLLYNMWQSEQAVKAKYDLEDQRDR